MQKVCVALYGFFFPLDVGQERFDSFQSDRIRLTEPDGFFEIPLQCILFDF